MMESKFIVTRVKLHRPFNFGFLMQLVLPCYIVGHASTPSVLLQGLALIPGVFNLAFHMDLLRTILI